MHHFGTHLLDPQAILARLRLHKGAYVADFGCGRLGHFLFPAAQHVEDGGQVYAVDILPDVLENITKHARTYGFTNVHTVWSDIERVGATAIPEKTLDAALVINTLSQTTDPVSTLQEISRLLKPKSRMLIVEWHSESSLSIAPTLERRVDVSRVAEWARAQHFAVQDLFDAGPHHQGVVLFRHV